MMTDAEITDARNTASTFERGQRQAIRWLGVVAIVSIALASVALYQNQNDARHNRERIDDIVAARAVDARTEMRACEQRNESIAEGNESRDAIADLLQGLRDTLTISSPEVIDLLDKAIVRNRVVIPAQDCTPSKE